MSREGASGEGGGARESSTKEKDLAENVFSGQSSGQGRASSQAELTKLIDQVVYPGRGESAVKDKRTPSERFAQSACGTAANSGFSRLSTLRKRSGVKREYDSLEEYQCTTCQRNLAANLALRPPTENMRIFVPGPDVAQSSSPTYHAVFNEAQADQLKRAGYRQVQAQFHAPDLNLKGFDPLPSKSPAKKPKELDVSVTVDANEAADDAVLTHLSLPDCVPGKWKGCNDLVAMMEKPFRLKDSAGAFTGPFTPIYMWPTGRYRHHFGATWKESGVDDAMSKLYRDYYNIKVRRDQSRDVLKKEKPELFENNADPFTSAVAPSGLVSILRSHSDLKKPGAFKTWSAAVLAHLKKEKRDAFRDTIFTPHP